VVDSKKKLRNQIGNQKLQIEVGTTAKKKKKTMFNKTVHRTQKIGQQTLKLEVN
jgi:hypothetical protein